MQNERNIRDNCQIRVRTNSLLPMANYVTDGQWVVSTKERIYFVISRFCIARHRLPSLLIHPFKL